jgi:hypothetical protein
MREEGGRGVNERGGGVSQGGGGSKLMLFDTFCSKVDTLH